MEFSVDEKEVIEDALCEYVNAMEKESYLAATYGRKEWTKIYDEASEIALEVIKKLRDAD